MIGTFATIEGERQYREALTDPKMRQIEPGIIMRPFHIPAAGHEQEWHVYCERHPSFGFCGPEWAATETAIEHGRKCESSDPKEKS